MPTPLCTTLSAHSFRLVPITLRMPATEKTPSFSLKDELFNRERIKFLASCFGGSDASFDEARFVRTSMKGLKALELKQRIVHISKCLDGQLDDRFPVAAKQIVAALPAPLDPTKSDDDFGDFIIAPLGDYVVRHGLTKKHLATSLRTLKQLTMRFSMEDAIRYFINAFPSETLETLGKWSRDKNYHVHRLVSEGTRPKLPWSGRVSIDPAVPLPLLDTLHSDPTRYVTRSVANHLNDIAKDDPATVIKTLRGWKQAKRQDAVELQWMTGHALRTLVKRGDRDALKLLGFRDNPKISVSNFSLAPASVRPGEAIEFEFDISAQRNESLLIDYQVFFVKANGTLAPKVHKLRTLELGKGDTVTVKKRHPFRANATTYTLYPGTHKIVLQINGKAFGELAFEMT